MSTDGKHTDMAAASLTTGQQQQHETDPSFEKFVRDMLANLQNQMTTLRADLKADTSDVLKSVEFCTDQVKDLDTKVNAQCGEVTGLQQELSSATATMRMLASRIEQLELENANLEAYMRRSNLIFEGCTEEENEDTFMIIESVIKTRLNLDINLRSELDKAHRYSQSIVGRPRPIIARFLKHSVRDTVLKSAHG